MNPKRFLLVTWGSRGDFHPFLSLAIALKSRGHRVTLSGNPYWQAETEAAGIRFVGSQRGSSPDRIFDYPELLSHKEYGLYALRIFIREFIGPELEMGYDALLPEAKSHDVLVAHHFSFVSAAVAESVGIPWVTVTLAPGVIPSSFAAPAGAYHQPFRGPIGRAINQGIWKIGGKLTQRVMAPVLDPFRVSKGLPRRDDYCFGALSERMNLLLYSQHFAHREPDYSSEKVQAGFCFQEATGWTPPPDLTEFLENGPKPWLFTLGTVAVMNPRGFYEAAVESVRGTSDRAILLTGRPENLPENLPPNVKALAYAPHEWIMPRCAAVAHQCGMGTLGQALRAGIPSVGSPFAFDQPNNAMRLEGLGVGMTLRPQQRSAVDLRKAFEKLLTNGSVERASAIGEKIRNENGSQRAAELLEGIR